MLEIMKSQVLIFALVASTLASAIPKPDDDHEHKNRVKQKELSDKDHFADNSEDIIDHNAEYDHEAFLGKDEAKTFDDLSPEEAKERLGIIYDKIDKNHDGAVTEEELVNWVKHVQNRYISLDTDRQWTEHKIEDESLTWESYKQETYGDMEEEEGDEEDDDEGYSYKEMMQRDQNRWKQADQDGDGLLSKAEFADFLHPEDAEHMRDIVIDETIGDIDQNKDGFISLEEYIADVEQYGSEFDHGEDEDENHWTGGARAKTWLQQEHEEFATNKDFNKDGYLNREEIAAWIMPELNEIQDEVEHLMHQSDVNNDALLTKQEVLDKFDLFVGSQATDYGDALAQHDEF